MCVSVCEYNHLRVSLSLCLCVLSYYLSREQAATPMSSASHSEGVKLTPAWLSLNRGTYSARSLSYSLPALSHISAATGSGAGSSWGDRGARSGSGSSLSGSLGAGSSSAAGGGASGGGGLGGGSSAGSGGGGGLAGASMMGSRTKSSGSLSTMADTKVLTDNVPKFDRNFVRASSAVGIACSFPS